MSGLHRDRRGHGAEVLGKFFEDVQLLSSLSQSQQVDFCELMENLFLLFHSSDFCTKTRELIF